MIYLVFATIFGLCIGSFLNAVIYRLEVQKSLGGRSFCPHCKHQLYAKDLVPLISFLWLQGKCRYCKKSISIQYPLVELATAIIFLLLFQLFPFSSHLLFLWYIASVLVVIFVYDLKHYLIPDNILLPAIAIGLLYRLIDIQYLFGFLAAALLLSGFFFALFSISKGTWIGFGDVKLALLMGLMLGPAKTLVALFLASLVGSLVGIGLIVFEKKGWKAKMPFGPFLTGATLVMMLWGDIIVSWYFNLLGI